MSFNPHRDGHKIWAYWHLMAANATTPAKRKFMVDWVNSQKEVFPCEECRKNLVRHLSELPIEPYSNTNVSLFLHSYKMHDTVNKMLKKSQDKSLTYDQAFAIYFPNQSGPGSAKPQLQPPITGSAKPVQHHLGSASPAAQPVLFERHMVAAGVQRPSQPRVVEEERSEQGCSTCNQEPPQFEKHDYQQFRQEKRRVYLPKN